MVARAADLSFGGDYVASWTSLKDTALSHFLLQHRPDAMRTAVHKHFYDTRKRAMKFSSLLPGMDELDAEARANLMVGWKWLAFFLFVELYESSDGGKDLRYWNYWADMMGSPSDHLQDLSVQFCRTLNEIGLTETETYVLMAVILFEPGPDRRPDLLKSDHDLHLLHRHYSEVFTELLKKRCKDQAELHLVCRKLERFFAAMKIVCQLYTESMCLKFRALIGNIKQNKRRDLSII